MYSRVTETSHTNSGGERYIRVYHKYDSAGDVVGFFIPRGGGGLRVAWASVPDHTLLRGRESAEGDYPVATISGSSTTLSSSPFVPVIFGKRAMNDILWHAMYCSRFCVCIYL